MAKELGDDITEELATRIASLVAGNIKEAETRLMLQLQTFEMRIRQRVDDMETKLMNASVSNLEDCVNTIEAVGESIRGMITAEGIRLKTQRVGTNSKIDTANSRIEAIGKRVDALEANQTFSRP